MDFSKAIEKVRESDKILIVSHYDCDGLCSAKILSTALKKEGKEVKVKIVKEISEDLVVEDDYEKDNFDLIIFSDLGSGSLSLLPKNKNILILDHHIPEGGKIPENIIQINPYLEDKELCGAGLCYLFASKLDKNQELMDYAIVGAIGDHQLEIGENKKLLEEAEKIGRLKIEKGLELFGHLNRPIHNSLNNSKLLPLKDCSEIVQFLSDLEINFNHNGKIKSYYELSKDEKERLSLGIIKERIRNNLDQPENIFSDIYILKDQPRELMDALEFSTILNAFGRLEKFDEALEVMNGNLEKLYKVMAEYRRKLATYLSWTSENITNFPQTENILFINAKEKIDENMIGTITSILINTGTNKKIVVGLASAEGGIKISTRSKLPEIDLNEIVNKICEKVGGTGGGHKQAAGGKIERGKEEEFIKLFTKELNQDLLNLN